ncbi:hypothetical protein [Tsukamurella tyrosinosolvens]|uniref:hypothetical protein n=1 Tax=Tsukamurella tyrosinosolvens TaxID=57704 RepID=UPI000DF6A5FD|nr:hypothetical protein [Tsukamurella tyrosinosolvens]RDB44938.1 hypothetical protein DVB87_25970 [Tsukamurella tyrosinosolvens]
MIAVDTATWQYLGSVEVVGEAYDGARARLYLNPEGREVLIIPITNADEEQLDFIALIAMLASRGESYVGSYEGTGCIVVISPEKRGLTE